MPEPIKLISGGGIIPLDLTPFANPTYRVDPSTLPGLPMGVAIDDIVETMWERAKVNPSDPLVTQLVNEVKVRTLGYLPVYDKDGYDQFGYDQDDQDRDGRGRDGLTPEERAADPMLSDVPRPPRYAKKGTEDRRVASRGYKNNRGNVRGQIILSVDGTERTLDKCWFDLFLGNETLPLQRRLSDEEILAKMRELFPRRKFRSKTDKQSDSVMEYRWYYNNGRLACQRGAVPEENLQSHVYVKRDTMLLKTTNRGRVVEHWDLTAALLGEKKRRNPKV